MKTGAELAAHGDWWMYSFDKLELVSKKQKKPRKTVTLKIGDVIKGDHPGSATMTITGFDYDSKSLILEGGGGTWAYDNYSGKTGFNKLTYVNGKKLTGYFLRN